MNISKEGIALIQKFEGCRLESYQCEANVWTLGWGHTAEVKEGDTCTQEEADSMLESDLVQYENNVKAAVKVELSQNQFDALVSFCYNLGAANLLSSTLLRLLNEGNYEGAAGEFKKWIYANKQVSDGLVRRREAESLLFEGRAWDHV